MDSSFRCYDTFLDAKTRREDRERRIADFALGVMLTAVQCNMGQALPSEEDARDAVRLGRSIFAEVDHPTKPPEDPPPSQPTGREPTTDDWRDGLYIDPTE